MVFWILCTKAPTTYWQLVNWLERNWRYCRVAIANHDQQGEKYVGISSMLQHKKRCIIPHMTRMTIVLFD
jgi:hypothetical protein